MKPDTVLGHALLGSLQQEPRSGYDLRKLFTMTPLNHFSDSPGAIYPALARLRARGWVVVSRPSGSRRRREFRLTPAGRRAWVAWLRRSPSRADVTWNLDGLMVRFAFMGGRLPTSAAVRFLGELARELDAHVRSLRRYLESAAGSMTATGRLALESGIESYEARARWARRARRVLARGRGRT